jgi:hypothetical protein
VSLQTPRREGGHTTIAGGRYTAREWLYKAS